MTLSVGGSQAFGFADGNAGHLCSYTGGGATGATTYDVLFVNSDTVVSTPSGWTLEVTRVSGQGAYIFSKSGGTSSVTITTSGDFNCQVIWVRVIDTAGPDTGAASSAGVDGVAGTSTPALTTPALAESGELAFAFAAIHSSGAAIPTAYSWSSGYTEILSNNQGGASSAAANASVASKASAGTAAESPSVSWTNNASDRYMLFLSLKAAAGTDAIAPSGIAVPAALGSPVLADSALAAAPSGIAVPAALGSPTLAGPGLAAAPSGIAVSAALGTPTLAGPGLAIAPSGIAIAATVGAPASVAMTVPGTTCAPSGIAVPVALGAPSLKMIDRGSWDSLLNAINSARADHEIDQERLRNPIDCPIHHWPLQPTSRGLHCKFGGHVVVPG